MGYPPLPSPGRKRPVVFDVNIMAKGNNKKKNGQRKPWRETVRQLMYQSALEEAQRKCNCETPSFLYRWEHVLAVVKAGVRLAHLTGADVEVVEAAAWLHDIAKEAKDDHPRLGAAIARKVLPQTDFPPDKIEAVACAIEEHMGLWLDTPLQRLESQVLWDADKLTKIGVTAAIHWLAGSVAANKQHTTEDMVAEHQLAEWRSKTVASMHTEPARRAAIGRYAAYDRLWRELEMEWAGEDLTPAHNELVVDITPEM